MRGQVKGKNEKKIVTIGVYGFSESGFFTALINAGVDTFLDIRQRRGMRGAKYAFANSQRLQAKLEELGIRYYHLKELSPTPEVRQIQKQVDQFQDIEKRKRSTLSQEFVQAYEKSVLDQVDLSSLINRLPDDSQVVALFCVEKEPGACHRSIVAKKLSKQHGFPFEDILP